MIIENKKSFEKPQIIFADCKCGSTFLWGGTSNSNVYLKINEESAVQLLSGKVEVFHVGAAIIQVYSKVEWWY